VLDGIQDGLFPDGMTFGIAHGTSEDSDGNISVGYPGLVNINALKRDGKIEMQSETALVAQNNKDATVSIVNEIPILKSTIDRGSGSASDVIQNIDRIEVGIKLNLTPRIIPGGEVQMELNPSIEAVVDSTSGELEYTPTIARRSVTTTVTVPDGETIVIAGLTRDDDIEVIEKVPILGSIPVLGFLFRKTETDTKKTNLLILVTPTVVKDTALARSVTKGWRDKTNEIPDENK
jgi:general secretion pathway protein D